MFYIVLAFLIGVNIVINMVLNGRLAQREGMINGLVINYFTAVLSSLILCTAMLRALPDYSIIKSIPLPYFLGGFIGVLTTFLFNLVLSKVSAIYVVILRFIGQMLASAAIDYLYLNVFSVGKVLGGVLFLTGLILNARMDGKSLSESPLSVVGHK